MSENVKAEEDDPVFGYMTGQLNADQPSLLAAYESESERALAGLGPQVDIAYGPHPRQRIDLFEGSATRGLLAYLHAGYWQSRDKAQFRFIAATYVAAGINVALVNYPLCPDVSLADLTEAVRAALPALGTMPGAERALVIAGHSAGAHLAVELALGVDGAEDAPPLTGIVALSGVYDLAPLLRTPLNAKLGLDNEAAAAASPLNRVRDGRPAALFGVGACETAAFWEQTERMAAAWVAAGNPALTLVVPEADHFSLLRHFTQPGETLFEAASALFGPAPSV